MKPTLVVSALIVVIAARPALVDTAVAIRGFGFKPQSVVIPVGTSVVWTNRDEIEHTVTAVADSGATPAFDGVLAGAGKSFRLTFDHAGTFAYACTRHSFMRGEIRVTPKGDH